MNAVFGKKPANFEKRRPFYSGRPGDEMRESLRYERISAGSGTRGQSSFFMDIGIAGSDQ
jgi:hypothetical protein